MGGGQGGNFGFQQGNGAGAVVFALVELLFQTAFRLRKGDLFLSGGNKGIDAPLQIGVGVNGHATCGDESTPLIDTLRHPQQSFSAAKGVYAGGGSIRAGIGAGKSAQGGVCTLGPAAQRQPIRSHGQLKFALHGTSVPGLKTVFVRQVAPLPGVQPVEHGQQKAGPGGLAPFIGGADHIQTRVQ